MLDRFVEENCALLGYYAASIGNLLPPFRDNLLVPSSRAVPPKDRKLSVNVDKELTTTRCLITQKSAGLIFFAAET